jgi:hypothetical protein
LDAESEYLLTAGGTIYVADLLRIFYVLQHKMSNPKTVAFFGEQFCSGAIRKISVYEYDYFYTFNRSKIHYFVRIKELLIKGIKRG